MAGPLGLNQPRVTGHTTRPIYDPKNGEASSKKTPNLPSTFCSLPHYEPSPPFGKVTSLGINQLKNYIKHEDLDAIALLLNKRHWYKLPKIR